MIEEPCLVPSHYIEVDGVVYYFALHYVEPDDTEVILGKQVSDLWVILICIVPTLCVVTHPQTLRITTHYKRDAERPKRHSHAEYGSDKPIIPIAPKPTKTAPDRDRPTPPIMWFISLELRHTPYSETNIYTSADDS